MVPRQESEDVTQSVPANAYAVSKLPHEWAKCMEIIVLHGKVSDTNAQGARFENDAGPFY